MFPRRIRNALVKRDEKREPDAKHERWHKEVTIAEHGFCLFRNLHWDVVEVKMIFCIERRQS
jgi:hypothetical protein